MTTWPANDSARPIRGPHAARAWVITVAVLAALLAGGGLGWWLRGATATRHEVRVARTFAGTVSVVSADGGSGCVAPDGGGRPVCSGFALAGGPVHRGDRVHAALEWAHPAGSNGAYNLVLIYPRQ